MIDEQILNKRHRELEQELEKYKVQLELDREKLKESWEKEKHDILTKFEKELTEKKEAELRDLKNKLERELNQRKREFIEQQIDRILEYMKNNYSKQLKDIIIGLEYDDILVPSYIDIPGARKDEKIVFGFIYRPVGKSYYVNMDMKRILYKYIDKLLDQL